MIIKQIKSLASLAGTQTWRLCRFAPIIAAMFAPLIWVLCAIRKRRCRARHCKMVQLREGLWLHYV